MKRFKLTRISQKMLLSLLIAELLSLAVVLVFTFFVTKPRLEDKALESAVHTGQQLADEIDLVLHQFWLGAEHIAKSDTLRDAIEQLEYGDNANISAVLTACCEESLLEMRSVALICENRLWLSDYDFENADLGFLYSPALYTLHIDPTAPSFSSIYLTNNTPSLNAYACVASAEGNDYYVVCVYDAEELMQTINKTLDYGYTGFNLAQINGPGFYSSGNAGNAGTVLQEHIEPGSYVLRDDAGYYIITQTEYTWRICGYISHEDFSSVYVPTIRLAISLCFLVLLLSLLALQPFLQSILRPIRRLQQDMEEAANGNLQVRAGTTSRDELGQLGGYFNYMLDQIRTHLDERLRMERSEQNMKYQLLISQVNYHFIFNAMSSINILARRQDYQNIITVNTALSRMLQSNMLPQNGELTGSLENELAIVSNYWTIQLIGRQGDARLDIDCDPSLIHVRVPCNLLQPLVENSLRHGIVDEDTGDLNGVVRLCIYTEASRLILEVSDNGPGFDEAALIRANAMDDEAIEQGRHIGLANLRKRLHFLYGDSASMRAFNGEGAVIHIEIPLE